MKTPSRPRITFDTNVVALPETRSFWATICEEIGQRMLFTPTAANEVLRRIRLETERYWEKALKSIDKEQGLNLANKKSFRRLSTIAAVAARDTFREEMTHQGSIYARMPSLTPDLEALRDEISERIPETIFDLESDSGIRDRNIVVDALAGGFDILASNNIESISHSLLREWIEGSEGQGLGLTSTILRPDAAEEKLRKANGKDAYWVADALARSCVTDPDNPDRAAQEILDATKDFHLRGMLSIKGVVLRAIKSPRLRERALNAVRTHGMSLAMRSEARQQAAASKAVERSTGIRFG